MAATRGAVAGVDRLTLLAFAGVVVFGGANAIAVKQTVLELAPFWGAAVRFIAAGVILSALVLVTRRPLPTGRSLTGAMLYGAVGFGAAFGLAYPGLRHAPAGTAGVLLALTPLLTFGLAIAHGQERFHPQGLVGGLIAVGGVAVIFVDQLNANVPLESLALLLLAALCLAESGVIVKWIPRSDPFGTNAVAMLTGGAILLVASLLAREAWTAPTQQATWTAISYHVIFGSVVMFSLFVFMIERWTASAASYSTLLLPLVTAPLGAWLFDERISPSFLVGGAVILLGVYVGAFLARPHRSSGSSLPECLPVDACPPPTIVPIPPRPAATSGAR